MNRGRLFVGVVIVAVGLLLLLGNLELIETEDLVDWWPLLIVLGGLLSLSANPRHWPVPTVIVLVGVMLLLSALDVVDLSDLIFPALIIAVGLIILLGRTVGRTSSSESTVSSFVVFAGSEVASRSKQFQGGNVSAVFGGVELDLRDATPAPAATLDVLAAFGGVEVMVPQGWQVTTRGFPIFGGIENATAKESLPDGAPHLMVNATVLFGGLEIKH